MTDKQAEARVEATELRERAAQLRRTADHLEQAADALAGCDEGAARLGGRLLADKAAEVVGLGESVHYLSILERIRDCGYEPTGKRPESTLLAVLNRSPQFAARGHRSGEYIRQEAPDA